MMITSKTLMLVSSLLFTMEAFPIDRILVVRSCELAGTVRADCTLDDLPGVDACPSTEAQDCSDDR